VIGYFLGRVCIGFNWLVNFRGVCALLVTWLRAVHEKGNYSHVFNKLLLILLFSLSLGQKERMSLHIWFRLCLSSFVCSYVGNEKGVSSIFPGNGSFVSLRKSCFALLIPSKYKISNITCADHKCLLQSGGSKWQVRKTPHCGGVESNNWHHTPCSLYYCLFAMENIFIWVLPSARASRLLCNAHATPTK